MGEISSWNEFGNDHGLPDPCGATEIRSEFGNCQEICVQLSKELNTANTGQNANNTGRCFAVP